MKFAGSGLTELLSSFAAITTDEQGAVLNAGLTFDCTALTHSVEKSD